MKYWSDTQERTGGAFYWSLNGTDWNEVIWSQTNLGGNDYQGTWTGNVNILSGLSPNTSYQLYIYAKSWGSGQGDSFLSNGGSNYIATFTTDGSVPIEMNNFDINLLNQSVKLTWQTSTEADNFGFDIERQTSSNVSWQKIGFVEGSGTSNSPKDYSFIDEYPLEGLIQYRLKQIDFDGSFSYSKVLEINYGEVPQTSELIQNFPNPFNPSTVIGFRLLTESHVQLKIYDILGNEIKTLVNGNFEAGNHKVEFDGSNLPSGIYLYKIITPQYTQVKKMILAK